MQNNNTPIPISIRIRIFIAYSKHDKSYLKGLLSHFAVDIHNRTIEIFYDNEMKGGEEWDKKIKEKLNNSDIILLLVSANFVDTDYCYKVETPIAMNLHNQGKAEVVPILVTNFNFQDAKFAHLNFLPNKAKPISSYTNRNNAYTEIVLSLKKQNYPAVHKRREAREKQEREAREKIVYIHPISKTEPEPKEIAQQQPDVERNQTNWIIKIAAFPVIFFLLIQIPNIFPAPPELVKVELKKAKKLSTQTNLEKEIYCKEICNIFFKYCNHFAFDDTSKCKLGYMYEHGHCVNKSYEEAEKWYKKAEESDLGLANLCDLYYKNKGGKAENFLLKAATNRNNARAKCNLGLVYLETKQYKKAEYWILKSAEQGDDKANYNLGLIYLETKQYKKAEEYFLKSAEQGDDKAQYELGEMYQHGKGEVLKDIPKAKFWYKKAAEQGHAGAKSALGGYWHE